MYLIHHCVFYLHKGNSELKQRCHRASLGRSSWMFRPSGDTKPMPLHGTVPYSIKNVAHAPSHLSQSQFQKANTITCGVLKELYTVIIQYMMHISSAGHDNVRNQTLSYKSKLHCNSETPAHACFLLCSLQFRVMVET